MSAAMYRYEVPIDDEKHTISVSGYPVAVASMSAYYAVEFWAENDNNVEKTTRAFRVFGTGQPLPEGAKWIGTCARDANGFVWHLYEVTS